jgi:hypothetical protein
MLPFHVILAVLGAEGIRSALAGHAALRRLVAGALAAGLFAQALLFSIDLYSAYPNRAAPFFDTGEIAAITTAPNDAAGHRVYLSSTLEPPYIEAFFAFLPPPPAHQVTDDATPGLAALGMQVVPPDLAESEAAAGDMLVLAATDLAPPGVWTLVATERGPANPLDAATSRPALETVYRKG